MYPLAKMTVQQMYLPTNWPLIPPPFPLVKILDIANVPNVAKMGDCCMA